MMEGIKFSRQICDEDPNFMVIVIRIPRASDDDYSGDYTGEAAQHKAMKYILASAAGMLQALGVPSLAEAVNGVGQIVEQSNEDAERKAAAH